MPATPALRDTKAGGSLRLSGEPVELKNKTKQKNSDLLVQRNCLKEIRQKRDKRT